MGNLGLALQGFSRTLTKWARERKDNSVEREEKSRKQRLAPLFKLAGELLTKRFIFLVSLLTTASLPQGPEDCTVCMYSKLLSSLCSRFSKDNEGKQVVC